MIESVSQLDSHLVEIVLKPGLAYASCQICYRIAGQPWKPASLYPDLDPETALNGSAYLWNQAQTVGTVRLQGLAAPRLYWNPYLNVRDYSGAVQLQAFFITAEGSYEEEAALTLDDRGVVFLDDWKPLVAAMPSDSADSAQRAWGVVPSQAGSALCLKGKSGDLPGPLSISLPAAGWYDIYFGIAKGGLRCLLKFGSEPYARFEGNGSRYTAAPETKINIELYAGRRQLDGEPLSIAPTHRTAGGHHEFGYLSYVKLVPCRDLNAEPANTSAARYGRRRTAELILYYEPYSYAINSGIHDTDTMNQHMLEEFLRLGPAEIACQTVRIGSKALHRSGFLESFDQAARADDNTVNDDFVKLARNGDVLQETVRYAQGSGTRITSCVGMNRPYLWNPTVSEKFTRDNPQWIRGSDFDYEFPEVRQYALRLIGEIVDNYEVDGLVLDYMRHWLHQTPDTLTEIIGGARALLDRRKRQDGGRRELKVRFPADHRNYYEGLKTCIAERYVDGLIPSNLNTTHPLPAIEPYVRLCRNTGVKVYGCIDGWTSYMSLDPRIGAMMMHHTPKDVVEAIDAYTAQGAAGIFVYQADQFTAQPYLRSLF
ncbi:hypothetical protein [Paenibacillus oceani]|uniref:Glycosyl hydrolase-like 10 domain-containing protein n=1 Tax=Paenibacillus oceani TaxID=2772510 RepID=A0A927GYI9_9BACL|nr:hypothetical protein [Paenibacillus oceani]MBD2861650.1 hypothetical protein [Paenibacillus oceani]